VNTIQQKYLTIYNLIKSTPLKIELSKADTSLKKEALEIKVIMSMALVVFGGTVVGSNPTGTDFPSTSITVIAF
jgi:hypothetical protein